MYLQVVLSPEETVGFVPQANLRKNNCLRRSTGIRANPTNGWFRVFVQPLINDCAKESASGRECPHTTMKIQRL
jgi:hypothetical protein